MRKSIKQQLNACNSGMRNKCLLMGAFLYKNLYRQLDRSGHVWIALTYEFDRVSGNKKDTFGDPRPA